MLGLLLLAGLGLAATAFVELVDQMPSEEEGSDEDPAAAGENALTGEAEGATLGDLLADEAAAPGAPGADGAPESAAETAAESAAGDDAIWAEGTQAAEPDLMPGSIELWTRGSADPAPGSVEIWAEGPQPSEPEMMPGSIELWTGGAADPAPGSVEIWAAPPAAPPAAPLAAPSAAPSAVPSYHGVHGGAGDDHLIGTTGRDLLDGQGGDDRMEARGGADHLVTFGAGNDTALGGMGADSLHGYTVNAMPGGDASFVIEDQAADTLRGGLGADKLWLASGDLGAGGAGADEFHVSWDVDPDAPARITDYHPGTDRIVIEFTSHRADEAMTEITAQDQEVTTEPLQDGSGTAICLGGQPIAHVMGTTTLQPSDISLVHL